jgi:TolB-like protein
MSLINQLKQRKMVQWAVAYVAGAFALLQGVDIVAQQFGWAEGLQRGITLALVLGFFVALLLAWYHGERGAQRVSGTELLLLTLLLAIGGGLLWRYSAQPSAGPNVEVAAAVPAAPLTNPTQAPDDSIAVLPFVNMSADPEQEYFSDGLSEELLNLLAQLPQLRVIARTSSFSFKGKEVDVATIAKALNVAHVLEGSVRKSGNTLRITAQLIRTSDSSHLWSQTYDREMTDIFKVQDEIAKAVVDALKIQLLPNQAMTSGDRSSNPEAYNQFLIGEQFANQDSQEGFRRGESAYLKAIELDPGYGAAYARLALVKYYLADTSADKAVLVAPELANAYSVRGIIRLSFSRDWAGAQADLQRALQLNEANSGSQIGYWRLSMALGRKADATAAARRATELDPLNASAWSSLGRSLNGANDTVGGREALERALEISPDSAYARFQLGLAALYEGQAQEALVEFRNISDRGYGYAGIAMAEYSLGHTRESDQALSELIAKFPGAAYQTAQAYGWRGDKDKAFEWLQISLDRDDGGLTFMKSDPVMDKLIGDPRYPAFLRKLGLPE